MIRWKHFALDTLCSAAVATVGTTLAVAACGAAEDGNAIAPLNAISHIVWGDQAAAQQAASWKYTLVGVALNTLAMTLWAGVYELLFGRTGHSSSQPGPARALTGGVVVAALAYITDYHVVPERLTPGFELVLSGRAVLIIFLVLATSLGLAGLWRRKARN